MNGLYSWRLWFGYKCHFHLLCATFGLELGLTFHCRVNIFREVME